MTMFLSKGWEAARQMLEITTQDFYRLWVLAKHGSEDLYKGHKLEFQKEVQSDYDLIEKVELCWKLNVAARFETKQT